MGEEFSKMGEELAKGIDVLTGFDSSTYTTTTAEWTGTLKTESENFLLTIPVPGFSPSDLDVRVFANKVRIHVQNEDTKVKHDFELPEQIDPKLCMASIHRGILTLKVQKTGIVSTGVKIEVTEK